MSSPTGVQTVRVEGARLSYRLEGPPTASCLVLVNSLGLDLRVWEPQMPRLAADFRVLRFDLLGQGRSDAPPGPYGMAQLGRDLLDLLDVLAIARPHVCGLSLGGMVAQWLAAERPERVARVVLANTAHLSNVERPAACNEHVLRFLSQASGGEPTEAPQTSRATDATSSSLRR